MVQDLHQDNLTPVPSNSRLPRPAVIGLIGLVLFAANSIPFLVASSRTDMQGNPSTSLAYVATTIAAVVTLIWFGATMRWGWIGGVAAAMLAGPSLALMLMLQAQGVLPDLDYGLYAYAQPLGLALSILLATLTSQALAPLAVQESRASGARPSTNR